jgi:hypothetical protein
MSAVPLLDRFWLKVDRRGPDECWPWLAGLDGAGYGQFYYDGKGRRAHRVAWELAHGQIPPGLLIDHVKARGCTRRDCCNEAHLEPVTNRENTLRGDAAPAQNVLKTHCPAGHAYDTSNTYGRRGCRACFRSQQAAYRRTHKAALNVLSAAYHHANKTAINARHVAYRARKKAEAAA